jgi:alanine racemase
MNKFADSILTINLSAIANNYKLLQARGAEAAAVVKANAYGLGVEPVALALKKSGCTKFFVANLDEAINLRSILADEFIGVFHGVRAGQAVEFSQYDLTPVLNDIQQVKLWQQHAEKQQKKLPAVIHFDTGMNRLGLSQNDIKLAADAAKSFDLKYIMSHLACADIAEHPQNHEQLAKLQLITSEFPGIRTSFANSSGIFLGDGYLFDLTRPGSALYGVNPVSAQPNPMLPVVKLTSKILQIRVIDSSQSVGYGASCMLPVGAKIATVPVGYADGYLRYLSNKGFCAINGQKVPIVGRISMDLITLDVSGIEHLEVGAEVEIIGETIKVDDLAAWADTIGYEILTSLGDRYLRVYSD